MPALVPFFLELPLEWHSRRSGPELTTLLDSPVPRVGKALSQHDTCPFVGRAHVPLDARKSLSQRPPNKHVSPQPGYSVALLAIISISPGQLPWQFNACFKMDVMYPRHGFAGNHVSDSVAVPSSCNTD